MEMDLGSAIIGTISIIVCILPFILMNRSQKKRKKQFLQSLKKLAIQNSCEITQHECCGDFAIGIDESKDFVLFYKQRNDIVDEQCIDLSDIQSCKIINTSRTYKNKEGTQKIIEQLDLSFLPTANNRPEINLTFFKANGSSQLYGELQSIEEWSKLINDRLKAKK